MEGLSTALGGRASVAAVSNLGQCTRGISGQVRLWSMEWEHDSPVRERLYISHQRRTDACGLAWPMPALHSASCPIQADDFSACGHSEVPGVPNKRLRASGQTFTLEQQAAHKLQYVKQHALGKGRPPLCIVGHSIGARLPAARTPPHCPVPALSSCSAAEGST